MKADFEKGTKVCSHCKKELPLDCFRTCKKSLDGLYSYCRKCVKEKQLNWQKTTKGKEYQKKYRESLKWKEWNREYQKFYHNEKYLKDIFYKIQSSLRNKIYLSITRGYKSAHTLELLGCSLDELKVHLEQQFEPGMTWDNYGEWHIDHIIPCSYFDLTKEENQRICFNNRNLQPMWKLDNLRKGKSFPDNVEELVEFLKQEIKNV